MPHSRIHAEHEILIFLYFLNVGAEMAVSEVIAKEKIVLHNFAGRRNGRTLAAVFEVKKEIPDDNIIVRVVVKSQHRLRRGHSPAAAWKRRTTG